jgi:hypothetical protein
MTMNRRDVMLGGSAALGWLTAANLIAAAPARADGSQAAWVYTDRLSYTPGERAIFHISAPGETVHVTLTRLGAEEVVVFDRGGFPTALHDTPADASEEGCGWPAAFDIQIGDWPSGYYRVQVRAGEQIAEHCLIVRSANPGANADIIMPLSMNTLHAYNWWGGKNLYEAVDPQDIRTPSERHAGGRTAARWLSTQRPFAPGLILGHPDSPRFPNMRTRGFEEAPFYEGVRYVMLPGYSRWDFSAGFQNTWEHHMVRWLEQRGHRVDFLDQADLGREPGILSPYKLYVTAGHNEYMSWEERDEVERFTASGGDAMMLAGNHAFWQIRWERDHTRLVCYKSSADDDPAMASDTPERTTTYWAHPVTGRPETQMTGLTFSRGGFANLGLATARGSGGYTVYRPEHWALEGSDLFYGDVLGAEQRLVGWEVDGCAFTFTDGLPYPTGACGAPTDMDIIAIAPATFERSDRGYPAESLLMGGNFERLAESLYGEANEQTVGRVLHGHVAIVSWKHGENGGEIFNVGSCEWPYGLAAGDPFVERITDNVIARSLS